MGELLPRSILIVVTQNGPAVWDMHQLLCPFVAYFECMSHLLKIANMARLYTSIGDSQHDSIIARLYTH
jgi:hypothetical protein